MFALGYQNWLDVESELPDRYMPEEYLSGEFLKPSQETNQSIKVFRFDVRTPLTAIKGYTELLRMGEAGDLNEGQAEMLDQISENTERIRTLIDKMTASSQPPSGSTPQAHERKTTDEP